jgi:hypothetical protein
LLNNASLTNLIITENPNKDDPCTHPPSFNVLPLPRAKTSEDPKTGFFQIALKLPHPVNSRLV